MTPKFALTAGAAALVFAGAAFADGLSVKPGKWKNNVNISIEMNLNGQAMSLPAQNQSSEDCIAPEDATLDPSELAQDDCEITNVRSSGDSMSFEMACVQNGMNMSGTMLVSKNADGTATEGEFTMVGQQAGMGQMNISGSIVGERIGDC